MKCFLFIVIIKTEDKKGWVYYMKKIIKLLILLILVGALNFTISNASTFVTYFYLEPIKVESEDIDILSYEILIDSIESKIENTIFLQNTTEKEIETELIIPLENNEYEITIKNLIIKLNDVEVEYKKNDNGEYLVKTKISSNSGKKINIQFETDNDLQNAKIIKCNFDNLKNKKVGKLKIDLKIDDKNIPLVEKIYPGHYTFNDNVISVEYYNYEVNTITKDFIVKKETFNNLLYGRETQINDKQKQIINEWYLNGKISSYNDNIIEEETRNFVVENIIDYQKIKNGVKIYEASEPLLYQIHCEISNEDDNEYGDEFGMYYMKKDLKGKKVCIDYVESEGEKELYVAKNTNKIQEPTLGVPRSTLVPETEAKILRTKGPTTSYSGKRGAKIIFVGCGIDGEDLQATDKEKIAYVNQINADMYIRIAIYDGNIQYKKDEYGYDYRIGKGMVGYYDDQSFEIAKAFALYKDSQLLTEEQYNNYGYEYKMFYSNYEQYAQNYYKDYYKDCIIKLSNEEIVNKCEIPTVMQFIGNRITEDGKYVVDFFEDGFYDTLNRGLITTNAALKTTQAKNMLESNKQKNANIKSDIENKITALQLTDNELQIREEIKQEKLKKNENNTTDNEKQLINNKDVIVFASIGIAIFICIIILIIEHKKKSKRGKM